MEISLKKYYGDLIELIDISKDTMDNLSHLKDIFETVKGANRKVIIVGNGGSAAIASHVAVDLSKNSGVRAINFNEADLITCFANDFGFNNWITEALNTYADQGDVVVLISSSGKSENMINAARWCIKSNFKLITFTGMDSDNPLRKVNSAGLNFWTETYAYNHIETVHQIWLLSVVDMLIGSAEYLATPDGYLKK